MVYDVEKPDFMAYLPNLPAQRMTPFPASSKPWFQIDYRELMSHLN